MAQQTDIKYFEGQQIRTVWDADEEKCYYSVVDVVQVLTAQATVRGASTYWAVLKKRMNEEKNVEPLTTCKQLKLLAADGKMRLTDVADSSQLLEIIQIISSPKVEKFRLWLESLDNAVENYTGEIIMYQPDETIKLAVRLDNETVWLNRQQMAELFDRDIKTIGKHISNALQEELSNIPTVAKFATVGIENGRSVTRQVEYYNLDMVLSVGYRVKSAQGVKFRQWANSVLKQYLLKGYALHKRISDLESAVSSQKNDIADLKNKVDFFVRTSLPPVEGVFFQGQIFDAYAKFQIFIMQAQKEIILIDNYVDVTVLERLAAKNSGVSVTVYTSQKARLTAQDIQNFNAQYPPLTVVYTEKMHDRFLIIDNKTLYHIGASLKDLGKKCFAFDLFDSSFIPDILAKV